MEKFVCLRCAFMASPGLAVVGEGDGEKDLKHEYSEGGPLDCSSSSTMMQRGLDMLML